MSPLQIFLPCVALVALTVVVWIRLYMDRISEMRARRIKPQALSTSHEAAQTLQHVNAADNLRSVRFSCSLCGWVSVFACSPCSSSE